LLAGFQKAEGIILHGRGYPTGGRDIAI
jgi:hypothetical protein